MTSTIDRVRLDNLTLDEMERVILARVVARRDPISAIGGTPKQVERYAKLSDAMRREAIGYHAIASSPLSLRAIVRAAAYVASEFPDTAGKPLGADGMPTVGAGYGIDAAELAAATLQHLARWIGKGDKRELWAITYHAKILRSPSYAWLAIAGNADTGKVGIATGLARNALKSKQARLIPVGDTERVQGAPNYARTLDANGESPSDLRAAATIYGAAPLGVPDAITRRLAPLAKRLAAAGVSADDIALVVGAFDANERSQRLDKRGYVVVNHMADGRDAYRIDWSLVNLGGLSLPNARRRLRSALVVLAAYDSKQARRDNAAYA